MSGRALIQERGLVLFVGIGHSCMAQDQDVKVGVFVQFVVDVPAPPKTPDWRFLGCCRSSFRSGFGIVS